MKKEVVFLLLKFKKILRRLLKKRRHVASTRKTRKTTDAKKSAPNFNQWTQKGLRRISIS